MSDDPTTSDDPNEEPLPGLDDERSPEEVAEEWRQAEERDADGLETDDPVVDDLITVEYTDPPDSVDMVEDGVVAEPEFDGAEEFRLLASMNAEDAPLPDLDIDLESSDLMTGDLSDDDAERRAYGYWRPWLRKFRRGVLIKRGSKDANNVDQAEGERVTSSLPGWLLPTAVVLAFGGVIVGAVFVFANSDDTPQGADQSAQVAQQDAADIGSAETDVDTDGDGLFDDDELFDFKTDPDEADSDGDGVDDGDEIAAGTDPLRRPGETEDEQQAREDAELNQRIGLSADMDSFDFNIAETVTSVIDGLTNLELVAAGTLAANGAVVDQTPLSEQILVDFDFGWLVGTDGSVYFAATGPPVFIAASCIELDGMDASGPTVIDATMFGNSPCPEWAMEADLEITFPTLQSFTFDPFLDSTQVTVIFPTPFTVDADFEIISVWACAPLGEQWQYANYWLATDDLATGNSVPGLTRTEFELMRTQYPADVFDVADPAQRSARRMVEGVDQQDCFGYVHRQLNVEVFHCDIGADNVVTAVMESR